MRKTALDAGVPGSGANLQERHGLQDTVERDTGREGLKDIHHREGARRTGERHEPYQYEPGGKPYDHTHPFIESWDDSWM